MPDGFERALTAELWIYPEASRILELSMRFTVAQTIPAALQMATVMSAHGLPQSRGRG